MLALPTAKALEEKLAHVLSEIDKIRGEYGETGKADFKEGEPTPDMPETLCLFELFVETVGRVVPMPLMLDED